MTVMKMDLNTVLKEFARELESRSEHLTEDSVRYLYFACMLRADNALDRYVLELPYEAMGEKESPLRVNKSMLRSKGSSLEHELDLFYNGDSTPICFEFKFHRNPIKHKVYAYTDAAGSIFNDIYRLGLIHSDKNAVRRILVYVTDDAMHNYFTIARAASANEDYRNCLKEFYELPVGASCSGPADGPDTFIESSKRSLSDSYTPTVFVVKVFNADFTNTKCSSLKEPGGCHIRVYEVLEDKT